MAVSGRDVPYGGKPHPHIGKGVIMRTPSRRALTVVVATASACALVLSLPTSALAAPNPGLATRDVTVKGKDYHLVLGADDTTLSPRQDVETAGFGYNPDQGIYIALCAVPDSVDPEDPETFTERPGPCYGGKYGKGGTSHRVTNDDTGTPGVTSAYGLHGSFSGLLRDLKPEIEEGVVCGVDGVRCAIVTMHDHTDFDDRGYDQYIPVRFTGTGSGAS